VTASSKSHQCPRYFLDSGDWKLVIPHYVEERVVPNAPNITGDPSTIHFIGRDKGIGIDKKRARLSQRAADAVQQAREVLGAHHPYMVALPEDGETVFVGESGDQFSRLKPGTKGSAKIR